MIRSLFLIVIIFITLIAPLSAVITIDTVAGVCGSLTVSQSTSLETSGTNLPRFGVNQTADYTYDGSQASILTNGRTQITRSSEVDRTDSNYYAAETLLSTDYMGLAEDTAGMINIQPNEPQNMCDSNNFLSGDATTGSYPISESYEGRTGVVMHNGGTYQSEVGLNDGDVHVSGAADIESGGYLYQNRIITSKKGFDKNATTLNLADTTTKNVIARTAINGEETAVHMTITSDYGTITPAYDDVIKVEEAEQPMSISADRVNETVSNSTIEVASNLTEVELPKESPGLADVSNQSIVRE